jgi:hypothetical protein
MTDEAKKTGGEPDFDTDRAWDRFKRLAGQEPVPAFWRKAEEIRYSDETTIENRFNEIHEHYKKDGALEMNPTEATRLTQESQVMGATEALNAPRHNNLAGGAWRTESSARRKLRRLTAGIAAAAMVFALFTTPLGEQALAAMKQTFRIQHMVGVGITADDMASISELLESGSPEGDRSFNLAQYGTLTQSGGGKAQPITWSEAEKRMGSPLLQLGNPTDPTYQPASTLTFKLNVNAVNRLLTRLGSTTILPDEADGKVIRLDILDGIASEGTLSGKPVRLLQFGRPELTVEDGIDAASVRQAVLGLPVLPESLRTRLAAIGDWQSTLPVPTRDGVTTSLKLGGYDAVMTVGGKNRLVLWLAGDRMSLLSGEMKDFPTEAAFQQAAEELIRP